MLREDILTVKLLPRLVIFTSYNRASHDCSSVYHASRDRGLTIALHAIVACVSRFALVNSYYYY